MYIKWTDQPQNRLPRATAHNESRHTFNLNGLSDGSLSSYMLQAMKQPGERFSRWFEESGYEYEYWYIYHKDTNMMETNDFRCPISYNHHLGTTCRVCGQHG
jgi:hypothetical protein